MRITVSEPLLLDQKEERKGRTWIELQIKEAAFRRLLYVDGKVHLEFAGDASLLIRDLDDEVVGAGESLVRSIGEGVAVGSRDTVLGPLDNPVAEEYYRLSAGRWLIVPLADLAARHAHGAFVLAAIAEDS